MPRAHRFTGGHKLAMTLYARSDQRHIRAKESQLLTTDGVPPGHCKR
jgi:hypothetical protein